MTASASRGGWRRVGPAVAALAVALLTARLGIWQLDRAAQKIAQRETLTARGGLPPIDDAALARRADEVDAQLHRRAVVHGRWLASRTVFLDNRPMDGRVGFVVVTPLRLADGSALVVERGWQPRDFEDRTRVRPPKTPEGRVEIEGRLTPGPARLFEFSTDIAGPIRQNLDLDRFAREIGLPVRPVGLRQTGGDAADGLRRNWPAPAADVQKHYGYALQWFALCGLTLFLYVWFRHLRPRRSAPRA